MADKYFNKATKSELFLSSGAAHLVYDAGNPDHVVLDDTNPYFSALPPGQRLTFDIDGIPDGTEAIPAPIYTAEEQAAIDLETAGVTADSVTAARYLDGRGDNSALAAIDASVDAVVISSGLNLAQVSGLIA